MNSFLGATRTQYRYDQHTFHYLTTLTALCTVIIIATTVYLVKTYWYSITSRCFPSNELQTHPSRALLTTHRAQATTQKHVTAMNQKRMLDSLCTHCRAIHKKTFLVATSILLADKTANLASLKCEQNTTPDVQSNIRFILTPIKN